MFRSTVLIVIAFMSSLAFVRADALVTYTFEEGSSNPSVISTGVTASSMIAGAEAEGIFGFSSESGGSAFSRLAASSKIEESFLPGSVKEAIDDGFFFEFTITPNSGATLDLTSLSLDILAQNISKGQTGEYTDYTVQVAVVADMDGRTIEVGETSYVAFAKEGARFFPVNSESFPLDNSVFRSVCSPSTFRIYLFINGSPEVPNGYFKTIRISNVSLSGSVSK